MKLVYGVGIYEKGTLVRGIAATHTKYYKTWCGILARCYNEKDRIKNPAYSSCTVADDWLIFSNFLEWASKEPFFLEKEFFIDKDITFKGNKVYSKEFCSVVPREINNQFTLRSSLRGDTPIGVVFHPQNKNFVAHCTANGKQNHIGVFKTEEDAFAAYAAFKKKHLIFLAEKYRNVVSEQVYTALCNYEILITD